MRFSNVPWLSLGSWNKALFHVAFFMESLMSLQNMLRESAFTLFILTNFGLWCFFYRMSINEKYGWWSEICVCMIHDLKSCVWLFNLQKSWSIRDALYLEGRVGHVIFGKKPRVTNKSNIFEFRLVDLKKVDIEITGDHRAVILVGNVINHGVYFGYELSKSYIAVVWSGRPIYVPNCDFTLQDLAINIGLGNYPVQSHSLYSVRVNQLINL